MYFNSKYKNKKTEIDGIIFDSKKEAKRYEELKLLERAGAINTLVLQPKFELLPKQADERALSYKADFMYVEGENTIVEDVKGIRTKEYIIKRKLFKFKYPNFIFKEI